MYFTKGKYETPFKELQLLARKGDSNAQFKLGNIYHEEQFPEKNDLLSLQWYRKAGEQGHIEASYKLGKLYEFGISVDKDPEEALKWYRKSGELGNPKVIVSLINFYKDGYEPLNIQQNMEEVKKWRIKLNEVSEASELKVENERILASRVKAEQEKAELAKQRNDAINKKIKLLEYEAQQKLLAVSKKEKIKADKRRRKKENVKVAIFRELLHTGDETNCGVVIEINAKQVKISHVMSNVVNDHWVNRDQIYPAGYRCQIGVGQSKASQ